MRLLQKLGLKSFHEMSDEEALTFICNDRIERSKERAIGRVIRSMKGTRVKRPTRVLTLEELVAPELVVKLRATGKSDQELIGILKAKGVI